VSTAKIANLRNGTVTISGLTYGDLRLIARAISAGSFEGGDRGGEVSHALLRLSNALLVPCMFERSPIGSIEIEVGTLDPTDLYVEVS
jgi:hypothetical protein